MARRIKDKERSGVQRSMRVVDRLDHRRKQNHRHAEEAPTQTRPAPDMVDVVSRPLELGSVERQ